MRVEVQIRGRLAQFGGAVIVLVGFVANLCTILRG